MDFGNFQLRKITDDHGLPIHMDGARIMNAAAFLEVEPKVILQHVDSVNLCFSKVGTQSFVLHVD